MERVAACWEAVTSGHIFTDMSREDNDAYIEMLDNIAVGLASDGSPEEDWYSEITRPQIFYKK